MIALGLVIAGLAASVAAILILTFHYIGKDYQK